MNGHVDEWIYTEMEGRGGGWIDGGTDEWVDKWVTQDGYIDRWIEE